MSKDTQPIRELFIEELEQVSGGGPVEELLEKVWPAYLNKPELGGIGGGNTTMACCEEGPDNCC